MAEATSTRARQRLSRDQLARAIDLIVIGLVAGLGAIATEIRDGKNALQ